MACVSAFVGYLEIDMLCVHFVHPWFSIEEIVNPIQMDTQFKIRDSIVVSISACHAEDPGSIPGRGISYSWARAMQQFEKANYFQRSTKSILTRHTVRIRFLSLLLFDCISYAMKFKDIGWALLLSAWYISNDDIPALSQSINTSAIV